MTLAPQPGGGITPASAAVGTPQSRISLDRRTGYTLDVELPRGVRATAEMPDDGGSRHGADLTRVVG